MVWLVSVPGLYRRQVGCESQAGEVGGEEAVVLAGDWLVEVIDGQHIISTELIPSD